MYTYIYIHTLDIHTHTRNSEVWGLKNRVLEMSHITLWKRHDCLIEKLN